MQRSTDLETGAPPPPGRWGLFGFGLVGVGMFLGFGALAVSQLLSLGKPRDDGAPADGLGDVALIGIMALLGLFIARFYFAGWRRRAAPAGALCLAAPGQALPAGPVLPDRALRYDAAAAGKPGFVVGFLLLCAGLFAVLSAYCLPGGAGSLGVAIFQWVLFLFFAALTAFLVWLSARFVQVTYRQRRLLLPARTERWLPLYSIEVVHAEGFDVGNRSYLYEHPKDRSTASLIVGVDESPPWVVEGHVLVVHPPEDPGAHFVVRESGSPYALTAEDAAAIHARLAGRATPPGSPEDRAP
jgi:hypothetical protein